MRKEDVAINCFPNSVSEDKCFVKSLQFFELCLWCLRYFKAFNKSLLKLA